MIYNTKSLMLAYKQRKMFADKQLKRWNVYQQTYTYQNENSINKKTLWVFSIESEYFLWHNRAFF